MTHADSLKDIYNGLIHKYQFEQLNIRENKTLDSSRYFSNEKPREDIANKLEVLGQIANDLCQPQLADKILNTADELSSDGVPPMPM